MSVQEFDRQEQSRERGKGDKLFWLNIINETVREFKELVASTASQLVNTIKPHTFTVDVKNPVKKVEVDFPKTQNVQVINPTSLKEVQAQLAEIKSVLAKLDPKVNVEIPDSVVVKNFPKYPEFPKQPEFPKEVDVRNMGQIVKEIEKIARKIPKEIKVKQPFFQRQPNIDIDLKPLLDEVSKLNSAIESIKIPETNNKDVVKAVSNVVKSLDDLEFPVPQTASSWQHSLTMQSEDLPTNVTWKTAAGKKVMDYREFTAKDNTVYRKTYSYDSDGYSTGWTGWVKQ